ncbi:hypothetical protein ACQR1I_04705 [Bradyrhizobium sp. HKCCYLS2038]|uniref:hypothetical protein n=1 Tax=unclassified Bradyrhizobium TaxID=2631580 RepID=UPI003EC0AF33
MTEDELISDLRERVAWLERKMVRVLWLLISATSAFAGIIVAHTIDPSFGLPSIVMGVATWLIAAFIVHRQEFKGSPEHIDFIDS